MLLDEVAALTAKNRGRRDAAIDERLVRLRHEAFFELASDPASVWPPVVEDPFPDVRDRPPEIPATELNAALLGGAIQYHGCLLVRGLFSPELVERLVSDTDRTFRAREDFLAGAPVSRTRPWYVPFEVCPGSPPLTDKQREWNRACGAVWAADSPAALFDVLEGFAVTHIPEIVSEYLGEPAALSVNKCTLRRVTPESVGPWHQDGSFLGDGVRTVDVWVALTDCGGEATAPGLAIVPRRVDHVLPTTGGIAPITVQQTSIREVLDGRRACRPAFGAGDALLFDELFAHRTGGTPGKTRDRYALESWFFTPSTFPSAYAPLAI